jgi:hypothetical protein
MGADRLSRAHRQWVEQGLENGLAVRDDRWSELIAIGSLAFIDEVKKQAWLQSRTARCGRIRWKLRLAGAGEVGSAIF